MNNVLVGDSVLWPGPNHPLWISILFTRRRQCSPENGRNSRNRGPRVEHQQQLARSFRARNNERYQRCDIRIEYRTIYSLKRYLHEEQLGSQRSTRSSKILQSLMSVRLEPGGERKLDVHAQG